MGHNRSVATTPGFELVGRDDELARLGGFVGRLGDGPGAVLIRGEPGIGKTALWRETVTAAEREGVRTLVTRCAEAEMPMPLGAVSDILDPAFAHVADALAEPQRYALSVALGLETDGMARPDRLALPRAFVAALHALAADGPLLVAVDDVQWLDAASTRALAFAARRTGDAPIGVLATLRGGPDMPEPLRLAEAFDGGFAEVPLGPLSLDALQRLVRRRFDVRIPRSKLAAVHAASGGNPMFALEFARAAERQDAALRAVLPVPSSLQELVADRIRTLPASARPLLELVSAIERPSIPLLAQALTGLAAAEDLVDEAVAVGAIVVGNDGVVRFSHPLLASAVYFDMPSSRRRALHIEVADLLDDVEQQARHLALATSEPNEAIAGVVERAAGAAAARGAPDAAAAFASEAVRLTPPEDDGARVRRTFGVAGYLMQAGDVYEARERIEPLLDPAIPAAVRSQALLIKADTEHQDRRIIRDCLREATEIAPDPLVRCQALLRYAAHGGWISGDLGTALKCAGEAQRIAVELQDPALMAVAGAAVRYYEAAAGQRVPGVDDGEILAVGGLPRMAHYQVTPAISVGLRRLWAGDLGAARDILRREYDELVRHGSLLRLPFILMNALFDLEWRAGRWVAAETYAVEACGIAEDALPGGLFVLHPPRILLDGLAGRLDVARALAAETIRTAARYEDVVNSLRPRWALGHVELAAGDATGAWHSLDGISEALDEFGIAEPGWHPILPDVVETLVTLDRLDEAEAVLSRLETQATALDHRWAIPVALRCRALLSLADGDAEDAANAADRAAAALEELGFPLDHARALLVAGAARRRAGQRRVAAETLQRAIEILRALPAPAWLERAEDELRRASPRPRRDRELTSAECRVAALVAEGKTNREVAAQLFTTIATVEAHLTRIYRKAGVRSRTELARAVADGTVRLE